MNASANLLFEVLDDGPVGLEWRIVNDNVMGGRSRGDYEISEESLSFFGATNTNGGGFSSIRSFLDEPVPSESKKMKLLIKGDGRSYTVILRERRSRASFWATLRVRMVYGRKLSFRWIRFGQTGEAVVSIIGLLSRQKLER